MYFLRNNELSPQTQALYPFSNRSLDERVQFYLLYLRDIVPEGVTVVETPAGTPSSQVRPPGKEIQIKTPSGFLLMTGIITMEPSQAFAEEYAANKAKDQWSRGRFAPSDGDWRFFTGLRLIRFGEGYQNPAFNRIQEVDPVYHVSKVAAYLQELYNRVEHRSRDLLTR